MPTVHDATAPASGVVNVLSVIRRYRLRDFPRAFDQDALHHVGVPGLDVERTMHALKLLGLLDPDGTPTEAFARIRVADSADSYAEAVAELLRSAYAPIFDETDPKAADEAELRSAFERYHPAEERERMVSLFIGLLAEAGLRGDESSLVPPSMGGALRRQRQFMGNVGKPKKA